MASRLGNKLLDAAHDSNNLFVIPTKTENDEYSVMLTYCSKNFEEDIPTLDEALTFEDGLKGKRLLVFRIDKHTTNPYSLAQKMGVRYPDDEQKKLLRAEGNPVPVTDTIYSGEPISLRLTPNCTYFINIK